MKDPFVTIREEIEGLVQAVQEVFESVRNEIQDVRDDVRELKGDVRWLKHQVVANGDAFARLSERFDAESAATCSHFIRLEEVILAR